MAELLHGIRSWLFLLTLSALLGYCMASAQKDHLGRIVTGGPAEGEIWLGLDANGRLGFVRGFIVGVHAGNTDGCFRYDLTQPSKGVKNLAGLPFNKCMAGAPSFSKEPDYYVAQMTAFYKDYPADVGFPLSELMIMLSKNKTLKEIDEYLKIHGVSR